MATSLTGQDMGNWLWQQSDPNTRFNTYDPATGQWSAGSAAGWTRDNRSDNQFVGITDQIADYLRAMGFGGDFRQSGTDSLMAQFGGGREELSRRADQGITEDSTRIGRNPELDAWLQSQGLTLQQGVQHTPGASQKTWIQRLTDAQGNPVAVDAFNDRYGADDRFMNAVQAGLLVAGGAAAGQAAGAWNLGGGAAGAAPTLGAGATGAGITTQGIGAAELAGLGLSNSAPLAMAPTFGAGAGLTTAGLGSATELLGGLSSQSALFNPLTMAPGVEGLTAVATLGAGAAAPQLTTPGLDPGITQGLGLSNPAPLQLAPSIMGPGAATAASAAAAEALKQGGSNGLLDAIKNSGVGKAVGTVADLVGGGGNLAAIVGGALGATQGGKTDTATVSRNLDPRIDAALFGDGGYLSQLQQQFNATKGGNADMTTGAGMLRNLYQSPGYSQGYEQMRSVGQGLLGQGVAGNPFTNPGSAPAGLLGAFQPVARGQMPTTGLLPIPTRRGSI